MIRLIIKILCYTMQVICTMLVNASLITAILKWIFFLLDSSFSVITIILKARSASYY